VAELGLGHDGIKEKGLMSGCWLEGMAVMLAAGLLDGGGVTLG
jgi:hypothetical protein